MPVKAGNGTGKMDRCDHTAEKRPLMRAPPQAARCPHGRCPTYDGCSAISTMKPVVAKPTAEMAVSTKARKGNGHAP